MKNIYKLTLLPLIIILLVLCILMSPTFARSRFIDQVGLIDSQQAQILEERLNENSQKHSFDTVIAIVDELDYRAAHFYAADFFEKNEFGYGANGDGAILLLAMENKEMGFAAFGLGLEAFTPVGQDYLDKLFLPQISAGEYYEGFMAYIEAVDDFLIQWEDGKPYDSGNIPLLAAERKRYRIFAIIGSLMGALIVAFVVTGTQKAKLTSRREEFLAHDYVRQGSMVLDTQRDIFLYRNVHRERKPEKTNKGGGSFSTSSGNSPTGHSKKF
jgi:uncharacterized membrane protein YgcG